MAVLSKQKGSVLVWFLCVLVYVMMSIEYFWDEYVLLVAWINLTSGGASIKIEQQNFGLD